MNRTSLTVAKFLEFVPNISNLETLYVITSGKLRIRIVYLKFRTDNQVTTNLNNSNNNSNHIRSEHSSKKNLIQGNLPTKAKKSKHNKKRPECDGGDERDDVFGGLVGNNLLQGSSASVATAAASGTLNSRHHEILNHRGTTPIASEAG